ncbi:RNA-directed DNA polymerase, eukaryota, partial [Tanacetum coccineum]
CCLSVAYNDFVSDERVVWVDIEGIPLHVWSRETFAKIGNKWGEALDIEDNFGSSFARLKDVQVEGLVCHDRHLSDHRPILLREVMSVLVQLLIGSINLELRMARVFDSMVEHASLSFSHSGKSNAMVRDARR